MRSELRVTTLRTRECAVTNCPNREGEGAGEGAMYHFQLGDSLNRELILCGPCGDALGAFAQVNRNKGELQ